MLYLTFVSPNFVEGIGFLTENYNKCIIPLHWFMAGNRNAKVVDELPSIMTIIIRREWFS